jgi:hypothetical protein
MIMKNILRQRDFWRLLGYLFVTIAVSFQYLHGTYYLRSPLLTFALVLLAAVNFGITLGEGPTRSTA